MSFSKLRPIDASIPLGTPGLALLFSLAYLKIPELEEDCGQEAADYLNCLIGERGVFAAKVVEKDTSHGKVKGQGTGTILSVILYEIESLESVLFCMRFLR